MRRPASPEEAFIYKIIHFTAPRFFKFSISVAEKPQTLHYFIRMFAQVWGFGLNLCLGERELYRVIENFNFAIDGMIPVNKEFIFDGLSLFGYL